LACRILLDRDPAEILDIIQRCELPVSGSKGTPLSIMFEVWMDHALETQGEFQLRMCALALTRLLASKHPTLQAIMVR
jgi:hypothetical protein